MPQVYSIAVVMSSTPTSVVVDKEIETIEIPFSTPVPTGTEWSGVEVDLVLQE